MPRHQQRAVQRAAEVKRERSSAIAQGILERHRDRVEAAIAGGLRSKNENTRLKAAELALKLAMSGERQQATVDHQQAQIANTMSRDEMLAKLSTALTSGPVAAMLRQQIAEPIADAEIVSES
jgi:hypothetical protein